MHIFSFRSNYQTRPSTRKVTFWPSKNIDFLFCYSYWNSSHVTVSWSFKGKLWIVIETQKLKKKTKKTKLVDQVIFNLKTLKNMLSEYLLNLKKNLRRKKKWKWCSYFINSLMDFKCGSLVRLISLVSCLPVINHFQKLQVDLKPVLILKSWWIKKSIK